MALFNCGIRVEVREVKLSNMPEQLLTLSPKATVPVLQLPDGRVVDESLDIMRWALSNSDPNHWLADITKCDSLIEQSDNEFKPLLDYYKYAERHTELSQLEHRHKAEPFIKMLDTRLQLHSYLMGDQINLADIAILPFIRQFAGVDPIWFNQSQYTAVQNWLNQFVESNLFLSIMQKYSIWQEQDDTIYLG